MIAVVGPSWVQVVAELLAVAVIVPPVITVIINAVRGKWNEVDTRPERFKSRFPR